MKQRNCADHVPVLVTGAETRSTKIAGDFMKSDETRLEQSFFEHHSTKVDKSIGFLVVGLAAALMFSAFLFGMTQIHSVSSRTAGGDHLPIAVDEPTPEIGDTVETSEELISRTGN